MLEVQGRSYRLHDGQSRRSFLKVGSLGLAGLSLPAVLQARAAQAAGERKDTAIILFWMAGGPSHLDTYDMKPEAQSEVRGPFKPIATNLAGFQVNELLPRHARVADRLAIIRSLHHAHSVHDDASHWVQTGYPLLNARARGQSHPAQGAVLARIRGANRPGMPPYVCIPEAYDTQHGFYQASAYLGAQYEPLNAGGDPSLGNYRPPEFALPAGMSLTRLQRRRELLGAVDALRRETEAAGPEALTSVQQSAFDLVTGARAREAFDVTREPEGLREKYGRHAWGQAALLSRRLVEAGVTFVTINLYEKDVDWWDDHYVIEKNLRRRLPMYDQALVALIEDLRDRGLADRVLVAAFGEFGRAPRIDSNAGRGHWPGAMAALLTGGGIRGGQIVGSTTANGGEPDERPLVPGDLLATMYRVAGVSPEATLLDRTNRPIPLVDPGTPISELF